MSWYVIQTRANAEKRVVRDLQHEGVDCYVPCETRWSRSGRQKRAVPYPLFPRYLFAKATDDADFCTINATDGVDGVLGTRTGTPVAIDYAFVEKLKTAETLHQFDRTYTPPKVSFAAAQPVRVLDGPFSGFIGEIVHGGARKRFEVLMNLFGRETPTTIEARFLKAA